jgi:DNA transformation protein
MFGGVGLFHGGVMFGLLVRDTLHLRVDERSRAKFEAAGSGPFTYSRSGREVSLNSYYAVPEELFDEPDELLRWAQDATAAAHAAHRK